MALENLNLDIIPAHENVKGRLAITTKLAAGYHYVATSTPKTLTTTPIDIPAGSVVLVVDVEETPKSYSYKKFRVLHNEILVNVSWQDLRLIDIRDVFKGKTFCITGELSKPRDYFKTFIKLKGGNFKPSLSSAVDYLICGEQTRIVGASTKQKKAEQLGIPIITERQFYKMFVNIENG